MRAARLRTLVMTLLLAGATSACGSDPKPAILLVTIDTLRADHLSGYGYGEPTSPHLDRLMARGATFTWAFSTSSSTAPSHASILTGLYPPFHSVGAFNGHYALGAEVDTLAEALSRRGFRTAAVVSNPVLDAALGLDQGFEVYDDRLEGEEINRGHPERYADAAVDRALALLDGLRGQAFFLWLHVQDPHGPYDPPESGFGPLSEAYAAGAELPVGPDYSGHRAIPHFQVFGDERSVGQYVRRYDAEIVFADAQLGRLFDALAAHGELERMLVIVTSDHGEALGEDDFYFAHSHSLGLDQVHVPLVLAGPGITPGLREERPVSNAWIFDTVLRFASGRLPDDAARPGRDLLEAARGSPGWQPEPVFMASLGQVAVAQGGRFARRDAKPPRAERFWSRQNPNSRGFWKPLGREVRSLGAAEEDATLDGATQELLREHQAALSDWRTRFQGRLEAVPMTPERIDALRALGYLE